MRRAAQQLVVATVLASAFCWTGCGKATADVVLARKAVEQFHARMDARDYAGIYAAADEQYKASVPEARSTAVLSRVRGAVGKHKSSSQTGFSVNFKNGVNLVKLTFQSEFEERPIEETFEFIVRGPEAKLFHYQTKSKD
jgi:hypothetical protein